MRSSATAPGKLVAAALQAEVAAYIGALVDEVDEHGWHLVVRNGYHAPRVVTTAAGAVPVKQPRVDNVLAALPKSAHPGAKRALAEIYNAENTTLAVKAATRSPRPTAPSGPRRSPRSPTTSTCCWRSTTTPPSTGSTCAPPTRSNPPSPPSGSDSGSRRDPASRAAGVAMAFKLIESAQAGGAL